MSSNITPTIKSKLHKNLHNKKFHPIEIIKHIIYNYFGSEYKKFDEISPIVSTQDNFDRLLIPVNHPARSASDTYYVDDTNVLRTHTSAHQYLLLSQQHTKFLVTGDVYRKDEVDSCHYPVFHQMEGVCVVNDDVNVVDELKNVLIGLVKYLFPNCEYKISDDYFPFTHPSFEIEVLYNDKYIEILGCGVMKQEILESAGVYGKNAWAFGLGLERLAMILFSIPDIRYFWCNDDKFLNQFVSYDIVKFVEYSKLDELVKDISFFVNENIDNNKWIMENDFFEMCRDVCNDMVKEIVLFDTYYNSKLQKYSRAYHVTYSCTDSKMKNPGEFNELINKLHLQMSLNVCENLNLVLR